MFTVGNLENTDKHKKENINCLEIATSYKYILPVFFFLWVYTYKNKSGVILFCIHAFDLLIIICSHIITQCSITLSFVATWYSIVWIYDH